jgi:serine/threonine protein kinase
MAIDPVHRLYLLARAKSPPERAGFLDQQCGGDRNLCRQVEALLAADERGGEATVPPQPPANDVPTIDPAGPASATNEPAGATGSFIGPYKLLQKLGEGGMGAVWVAEQSEPVKRRVALKVIKAGMDSAQVLRRFEAERQALALMDHTNIAKVFDGGTVPGRTGVGAGRPYFVMELVKGVPITRYCDELHLGVRERLELFVPVCQAIQHAHQKGIIHRDIKPSNVLVCMQDGKPVPKVIDFGVAKALHQRLTDESMYTEIGQIIGTLEYMSPEQAELSALDIDTRADVYALGVLLYELLTGTTPFDKKRLRQAAFTEMLRIIKEEEPPRPSTRLSQSHATLSTLAAQRRTEPARLARSVRGELDWIVMKCLEKDRTRRYETANGLARDIERHLHDEPVEACPPSARYRLGKLLRRNKGPVIAACLVVLALLGGFVGTGLGFLHADGQRRLAEIAADHERDAKIAAETAADNERHAKLAAEAAAERERQAKEAAKEAEQLAEKRRALAEQEKQRADREADAANRARADTSAFSSFLVDHVLSAARPEGINNGLGVNVTVAEALKAAEKDMDKVFAGRPLAEAEARHAIGFTWCNLGKPADAEPHLLRALELRRRELGPNANHTLYTRATLAHCWTIAGRLPEAIASLEEVRQVQEKSLPLTHPDFRATLRILGPAYLHAGKVPQGVAVFELLRDADVAKHGRDHPETLQNRYLLAGAYINARRVQEAIDELTQVRDAFAKLHGAEDAHTLFAANSLALAYQQKGDVAAAIELFEKSRDAFVRKFGPDHQVTLTFLGNLAGAYRASGRYTEAIPLQERVRDAHVKQFGAEHPTSLVLINNVARAYQDAGKREQAIPMFRQAAAGMEKLKYQHQFAGKITGNFCRCLEELEQFAEAETWRRKWIAATKAPGQGRVDTYAEDLAALGFNLIKQRKWSDAEGALRESLTLAEKKAPEAWSTCATRSMLGEALAGQKKYADAEPLLLAGCEGLHSRQAQIPPSQRQGQLAAALERVVRFYEATGKPEEAAKWKARFADKK